MAAVSLSQGLHSVLQRAPPSRSFLRVLRQQRALQGPLRQKVFSGEPVSVWTALL